MFGWNTLNTMLAKEHLQIIAELRKDARQSLVEVSKQTGIPHSTIHQRVREYEGQVIKKHTPLLNFRKIGFYAHAFLLLKTKSEYKEAILANLLQHKNLNSIYRVDSGFDFLIECIFRDAGEQKDFMNSLSDHFGVDALKIEVLDSLMQENFLTDMNIFAPRDFV